MIASYNILLTASLWHTQNTHTRESSRLDVRKKMYWSTSKSVNRVMFANSEQNQLAMHF